MRKWRKEWQERIAKKPYDLNIPMPSGNIQPIGYVAMQHSIRGNSPVKSYVRWLNLVPKVYREFILNEQLSPDEKLPLPEEDEYNLALLKHYRSLMPLAMEAHKPMFSLTSADGVVGAHVEAVLACYEDFLKLAKKIGTFANVSIS